MEEYFYPRYLECINKHGSPYQKNPAFVTCVQKLPDQCSPDPCNKKGTHVCQDLMGNFYCQCRDGWAGRLCDRDVNECSQENGGCSQICYNQPGSFQPPRGAGGSHAPGPPRARRWALHLPRCDGAGAGGPRAQGLPVVADTDECVEGRCEQVCANSPGSYTCHCDGRGGLKLSQDMSTCEDILPCVPFNVAKSVNSLYLGRMFSAMPVIKLLFKRLQPTRLVAEFDFRTFDPEGILFFAGGHRDSTWIVLGLRAGRLELQLRYQGVGRVTSSGPVINHGSWQTVSGAPAALPRTPQCSRTLPQWSAGTAPAGRPWQEACTLTGVTSSQKLSWAPTARTTVLSGPAPLGPPGWLSHVWGSGSAVTHDTVLGSASGPAPILLTSRAHTWLPLDGGTLIAQGLASGRQLSGRRRTGGSREPLGSLSLQMNPRLDGCLKSWHWLDGEDTAVQETVKANVKMQCFSVTERGSFFPGSGFAFFHLDYARTSPAGGMKTTWAVEAVARVRPAADTGVLLALVGDHQAVALSVALVDYHSTKKLKKQVPLAAAPTPQPSL
ncbi:PREDICTED: growth arrest-specific protein 6 [Bison bison bison]|uniref:Growth arrest-specific protein 6 n=1 Tax=Bison bison bison TaxID=43346 RepID=A0A6P3GTR7_BISBB|nr:PREDICTED: growth arrest-specific protein 6 [Bison bison bison]